MIIDEDLLLQNGAEYQEYEPREVLFRKDDCPRFFFQIVSGTVELNNYHEDGKEFTLNILSDGQSIGESLLFSDNYYPMNATAKTLCTVLKLAKSNFLDLLLKDQASTMNLFRCLSDRLYYKYIMLFNNSTSEPVTKIRALLDYFKRFSLERQKYGFFVPFTRQQIANLTGLRVETVIRAVKNMEKMDVVQLSNGKIYY
ncbi:Crp/Fnr family transcriptional regulator [Chryseobacterium sp. ISL-6]|uniref:Crp/Fnr family transcriptional regulator n=1 Tax=Chryseobacterium sp. ISL-6 TaxID=2819143 RepID=UPI001BEC3A2E|nr:Crp/Fnr family transcriptional regulator [Chryseobacterium sp. ISL-6]MBT2621933.1 Crp/Fnr family transcriptional regulator [Chryseobacterium sp. ISL-6]